MHVQKLRGYAVFFLYLLKLSAPKAYTPNYKTFIERQAENIV